MPKKIIKKNITPPAKNKLFAKLNASKTFNNIIQKGVKGIRLVKSGINTGINKGIKSIRNIEVKDLIDTHVLIEPNFLLDVLIKFILIASFIYILYKYFLVDMTVKYVISSIKAHVKIYASGLNDFLNTLKMKQQFVDELQNQSKIMSKLPSTVNSTINDTNFMIIYVTFLVVLTLLIGSIIFITGGYKKINYENVIFNIILNMSLIVVSQVVFFYLVYSYFDPIKLYKFFYNNDNYKYVKPTTTTTATTTTTDKTTTITTKNSNTKPNSINNNENATETSNLDNNPRETIIQSKSTATIYVLLLIFLVLFILFSIITICGVLIKYYGYSSINMFISNLIPFNKITLSIYGILSSIFLFGFIIMMLLMTSRISSL